MTLGYGPGGSLFLLRGLPGAAPAPTGDLFAIGHGTQRVGSNASASGVNSILYAQGHGDQIVDFEVVAYTASLPASIGDWDPAKNIKLGTTPKVTAGTSVPVATLSTNGGGSRTFATGCPGLQFKVTDVTGGTARGQAKFQYSVDDGVTFNGSDITTAATYDITTGAATGLTLNFPTGTYAASMQWAVTVEEWTSCEGHSYVVNNTTVAQQPIYLANGFGSGKPALDYDGVDDRLVGTISAITTAFSNSCVYTLTYKAAFDVIDASMAVVSVGQPAGTTGKRYWGQSTTGSGRYNTSYRNDANAAVNLDRSINDVDTSAHIFQWFSNVGGTASSLQVDGGTANPNAGTSNPGTLTPTRLCFGAEFDNVPAFFFNGKQGRTRFHDNVLDSGALLAERNGMA